MSNICDSLQARKDIIQKQDYIASLCSKVLQNSNENVGKLRELVKLLFNTDYMNSKSSRRLLVSSICLVFKDILPQYKIRLPTEEEMQQQMKKETKSLWMHEASLLKCYEMYVRVLQFMLKDRNLTKLPKFLEPINSITFLEEDLLVSLKCCCALYSNNGTFNFSSELLAVSLHYLTHGPKHFNEVVSKCCQSVFKSDSLGNQTLDICVAIHRLCRGMNYKVSPIVASTIANIPIREVIEETDEKKPTYKELRQKLSRKQMKKNKADKKLEKDMAQTKAAQERGEKLKVNTLILKEVLFVYFKIVKTTNASTLLRETLRGLSNYSHLINVEYVESLIELLNKYMSEDKYSVVDGLYCIHAVLSILTGRGASTALQTHDFTKFHNHLYSILGQLILMGRQNPSLAEGGAGSNKEDWVEKAYYHMSLTPAALAARKISKEKALKSRKDNKKFISRNTSSGKDTANGQPRLVALGEVEHLVDLVISCINLLLSRKRRETVINRVLAFLKRLASLSLILTDAGCIANVLVNMMGLMRQYSQCEILFDTDAEIGGPYRPDLNKIDFSRAASATLWELAILLQHWSPTVRNLANVILKWGHDLATCDYNSPNLVKWSTMNLFPEREPQHEDEALWNLNNLLSMDVKSCRFALAQHEAQLCLTERTLSNKNAPGRKRGGPTTYNSKFAKIPRM